MRPHTKPSETPQQGQTEGGNVESVNGQKLVSIAAVWRSTALCWVINEAGRAWCNPALSPILTLMI